MDSGVQRLEDVAMSDSPHLLAMEPSDRRLIERLFGMLAFGSVLIEGLGVFRIVERRARRIRHPLTKEWMEVAATREVRFRSIKASRKRAGALRPSEKASRRRQRP